MCGFEYTKLCYEHIETKKQLFENPPRSDPALHRTDKDENTLTTARTKQSSHAIDCVIAILALSTAVLAML